MSAWAALTTLKVNTDQINAHLLNWQGSVDDRKQAKKWWRDRAAHLKSWGIFKLWMAENPDAVAAFQEAFEKSVKVVARGFDRWPTRAGAGKVRSCTLRNCSLRSGTQG